MNNIATKPQAKPVQNTALPKPKAILFDWDNTLVNTFPVIIQGLRDTFVKMGMEPWSDEDVLSNREGIHHSLRDSFPRIFGERWEDARDAYYQSFLANHLNFLEMLPGADATLQQLAAQDIFVGIVSNKTGKYLRIEVEHLGWGDYFNVAVGATDAEKDKPHPDPVHLAMKDAGITIDKNVWLIGDSDTDVKCAQNSGVTPLVFGTHIYDMVGSDEEREHIKKLPSVNNHGALKTLLNEVLS